MKNKDNEFEGPLAGCLGVAFTAAVMAICVLGLICTLKYLGLTTGL